MVRLHKVEIAKRQIEVAAELFLNDGDFLAIITLAGAAEEILGTLVRRQNKKAMIDHLVELDKRLTGGRDFNVINQEVNLSRNALKHARDPNEDEMEIEPGDALAMLMRAIVNYTKLEETPTPNMIKIYEHTIALYPIGSD